VTDERSRWTRSPLQEIYGAKLRLPSFGISVTRSDPSSVAIPAGLSKVDLWALDSGDAFSVSYLDAKRGATTASQDYMRLDPGYLRRVLLRILEGEEYQEIVRHNDAKLGPVFESELPEGQRPTLKDLRFTENPDRRAQVRITDLRMAKDLKRMALRRELKMVLSDLRLPVTTDTVTQWKYETLKTHKTLLKKPSEWSASEEEEEGVRVMVVSFAAAALLLFLDLDMRRLAQAEHDDLAKLVENLLSLIQSLIEDFDKYTDKLLKLMERSEGGRPPHPEAKFNTALVLYRMGRPLREIAYRVGITPPTPWDKGVQSYNKNWKNQLYAAIARGISIEEERFPRATAVFARRNDEGVRAKALETYHNYLYRAAWLEASQYLVSVDIGDDLLDGMPMDESQEEYGAYVQLGSCLENGIDPVPRSST
jgi:hypothetical protein